MSDRAFMQLYPSDFIGDTMHLSTEQVGAYLLLLMAMWNADGRLPDDEKMLARIARVSIKKWRGMSVELMPFFVTDGQWITNNRLTKELQKVTSQTQSRRAAGAKGGLHSALKRKQRGQASASNLLQANGQQTSSIPESRYNNNKLRGESPRAREAVLDTGAVEPYGDAWFRCIFDAIDHKRDVSILSAHAREGRPLKTISPDPADMPMRAIERDHSSYALWRDWFARHRVTLRPFVTIHVPVDRPEPAL